MGNIFSGYFLLVFLSAIGVLQIAAAYAGLKGLSFFKRATVGYIFGFLLIGGTFAWFFTTLPAYFKPNVLEGPQQFGLFIAAVAAAFLLTAAVSSLIKSRHLTHSGVEESGLESLKDSTYFRALRHSMRRKGR
jgi:hypothetical protein